MLDPSTIMAGISKFQGAVLSRRRDKGTETEKLCFAPCENPEAFETREFVGGHAHQAADMRANDDSKRER